MNVNETDSKAYSEKKELIKYHKTEGPHILQVKENGETNILVGNNIVGVYETEKLARAALKRKDWSILLLTAWIYGKELYRIEEQKKGNNETT